MADTNWQTTKNGANLLTAYEQFVKYIGTDVPKFCDSIDVITNSSL